MIDVPQRFDPAVPVATLTEYPGNARVGDVALIHESIDVNGFYGFVIVQESTRFVLVGNHRLRAWVEAGGTEVPVLWIDVDDDAARRINLIDNRAADLASYDPVALGQVLGHLLDVPNGLTGTGYTRDAVDLLLRHLAEGDTVGAVGEGASAAERDEFRGGAESLVLPLTPDDHQAVSSALARLASIADVPDRSQVVLRLAVAAAAKV